MMSATMTKTKQMVQARWAFALVIMVWAAISVHAQQGSSLADAARQARAQKQGQGHSGNTAQQYADELAEDQSDNGAPAGFKNYNTGDYKIWVPAPYHVDGHDSSGVVLSGPFVGMKPLIVMLGTPFVAHFENNDAAFQENSLRFAHLYADQANCVKATVVNHGAYTCGLGVANLLGQHVTGNAVFVKSLGNIYPVFCVTPSDSGSRDYINSAPNSYSKQSAEKNLEKEVEAVKAVLQKCETVFQSIRIPEGPSAQKSAASVTTGGPEAGKPAGAGTGSGIEPGPLANASRGLHESPAPTVPPASLQNADSAVPPGLKVHPFTYCKGRLDCYNASVYVPASAQLVSSDCNQYVFETKLQGEIFLLLAGTNSCSERGANDSNRVRWNQLVLPETERAPGTASTVSSLQGTVDGKTAVITTMRFKKGLADWMGERAEVESNGVQLVVGCMGPRERFADAEAMCSALIGSLRLP